MSKAKNALPDQTEQTNSKLEEALKKLIRTIFEADTSEQKQVLNDTAFKASALVRAGFPYEKAFDRLYAAAVATGMDDPEYEAIIHEALADGVEKAVPLSRVMSPNSKYLAYRTALDEYFGGRLRYNKMTGELELDGHLMLLNQLRDRVLSDMDLDIPDTRFDQIVVQLAKQNEYSPVQEYLEKLPVPAQATILPTLADKLFGTNDEFSRILVIRWLVGAVARAMKPGCQMDSALVLKGGQGAGKTSLLRALALGRYYVELSGNDQAKDELMKLQGAWIVEYGEIETAFKQKDVSAIKSFLTSETDKYRPPYEKDIQSFPRSCDFSGTTNQDAFLSDPTGSRRFWVIEVLHKDIPVAWVRQNVDLIWAEAFLYYKEGTAWHLTERESQLLNISNEQFQTQDPWESTIACGMAYIEDHHDELALTSAELLTILLRISVKDQNKGHAMKLSNVMKALGYVNKQVREGAIKPRLSVKPHWRSYNRPKQGTIPRLIDDLTGGLKI